MLALRGGWLFVHVPRTGGNSFQELLLPHSDDRRTVDQYRDGVEEYEIEGPITDRKHTTLQEYHDRLPERTFELLFKFAVIRNPWERAISAHFCPIWWVTRPEKPSWSSEEFRSRTLVELRPMTELITVDGEVRLDRMLRFERLADDIRSTLSTLGLPGGIFPHRNQGLTPKPWLTYYEREPELIDLVAERYRTDIELFGYAFPGFVSARAGARRLRRGYRPSRLRQGVALGLASLFTRGIGGASR